MCDILMRFYHRVNTHTDTVHVGALITPEETHSLGRKVLFEAVPVHS